MSRKRHSRIAWALLVPMWMAAAGLAAPAAAQTSYEAQVLTEINQYRAERRLPPLQLDDRAYSLAAAHSEDMQSSRKLSHDGFRGRVRQSGYRACAENVGAGRRSPQALVQAWKNSSGHNANMLRPRIKVAGVRQVGTYVTFFACG